MRQLLGDLTEQECVIMTLRYVVYHISSISSGSLCSQLLIDLPGLWRAQKTGRSWGKLLLVTPTHTQLPAAESEQLLL